MTLSKKSVHKFVKCDTNQCRWISIIKCFIYVYKSINLRNVCLISIIFSSPELKVFFVRCLSVNFSHFRFLLKNRWAKFNQTRYNSWVKGIWVCSNEGPGPHQRGDNHENATIGWCHLKIFFSRTTGPEKLRFIWKLPHIVEIQIMTPGGTMGPQ